MDLLVCNKCFAPTHRGRTPFFLTQCGHIYCSGCIKQAEKQCPQCQQMDVFAVELQQPTLARVENFFAPLNETLESLHKTYAFQNNQMKIMLQRYLEVDKKYEALKSHYFTLTQNIKLMKERYMKLKMEHAEEKKKLMTYEMQSRSLNSSNNTYTPVNSDIQRSVKMRNAPNLYFSSCGTNVSQSSTLGKDRNMLKNFRVPHPQSVRSISSRGTSDRNSTYTFRH